MMATGKARNIKRSSGTSSTTTVVIFLALSGLCLWLFTSNSFAPLQSTNDQTLVSQPSNPVHEFPDDPVKTAMDLGKPDEANDIQENQKAASSDSDASATDHKSDEPARIENTIDNTPQTKLENVVSKITDAIKTEAKLNLGQQADSDLDNNEAKKTSQGKGSMEEQDKQIALETQTSEESSVTQKQQVEQMTKEEKQNNKQRFEDTKIEKSYSAKMSQNEMADEDERTRVQEYQHQEDKQIQSKDPNGATSDDQIQHDDQDPTHDSIQENPNFQDNPKKRNKKNKEKSSQEDKYAVPKESKTLWSTQADQSENQNERRNGGSNDTDSSMYGYAWLLCNTTTGADYVPCLDNEKVISKIHSRKHHEHRERHCPEDPPTCLVPLPKGYKKRIDWPQSRDKIWYHNVPHTSLAEYKGHQNWVKVVGEFLTFPGGGTQFIHGALHYIEFIQEAVPDIAWGKHSRVVLDVGCGVASFGGYLFDRDVLTMSFAPKDEHEAQVQFALERGIPAISAVMGSQRLPFPGRVYDVVHCARCRVPWHADGGALLLELNRVLRPGGYFVWSATPVYQKLEEDVQIWKEMSSLTVAMCWELVTIKKDKLNNVGAAIYQKPDSNDCYDNRKLQQPPMCKTGNDPNSAWYVPLESCMHRAPVQENERGSQWPEEWPERVHSPPYWLNKSELGIYGKPSPDDFASDYQNWKKLVNNLYIKGLRISWSNVRNVMDMRSVYGGFAAALKDMKIWVMNVVNVDSADTLPIIFERGFIGIYHDWCESFSTYPRTYDLVHADHLFSILKKRCQLAIVMAEVDRIARPGGKLIVRDDSSTIGEVENLLKSMHWKVFLNLSENQEVILSAQKSEWRPDLYAPPT